MLFSAIKPYNDGLSNLTATVIYNRADGYMVTAPLPVPLIQANSYSYNFPHSLTYTRQNNKYLTAILGDQTYVNPHLILSGKIFMIRSSSVFTSYQNPNTIAYNPAFPYQVTFQVPYFAYGPVGRRRLRRETPTTRMPISPAPSPMIPIPIRQLYGWRERRDQRSGRSQHDDRFHSPRQYLPAAQQHHHWGVDRQGIERRRRELYVRV